MAKKKVVKRVVSATIKPKAGKKAVKIVEVKKLVLVPTQEPVTIIVKVVGPETEAEILAAKLTAYLKSDLETR